MELAVTPEEFGRQVAYMRAALLHRGYHVALAAMELGLEKHPGKRKDGVSPEFSHQMFIAFFVLSITSMLDHPEETLAAAFLHDTVEDTDVGLAQIEEEFGKLVRDAVEALSKVIDGVRIPDEIYYERLARNRIASVVKGIDRGHNIHTMTAANWSISKMQAYLDFVHEKVLPMMKKARKKFTRQEPVYQLLKTVLLMQVRPIQLMLDAKRAALEPVAA